MSKVKSVKIIENIKSITLVVLFLSTILLLYFFWSDTAPRSTVGETSQVRVFDAADFLRPDRIEVSFGNEEYTIVSGENFEAIMNSFRMFSVGRSLSVEEISRELYEQEVLRRASIRAVFDYYIPFSALSELHNIDRINNASLIGAVSELAYVAGQNDNMFVYDRISGRHFRITGRTNEGFDVLSRIIAEAQDNYALHLTARFWVGDGVNSNVLFPFSFESNLHDVEFFPEDFSRDENKTANIIRSFFNENMDFVRRIEENGIATYMYGFGRIIVIAHTNGVLEFRSQDDDRQIDTQLTFLEAFEQANRFIGAHGGFYIEDGTSLTPYMREVVVNPAGQNGYRFIFGTKIANDRMFYENGIPMVVDVTNGRVSYFRRQLVRVNEETLRETENVYREAFVPVIGMIANNIDYITSVLVKGRVDYEMQITIEAIIESISNLDAGYVKIDEYESILRAVWIITIDGMEFYFGLEDGEIIGHSQSLAF